MDGAVMDLSVEGVKLRAEYQRSNCLLRLCRLAKRSKSLRFVAKTTSPTIWETSVLVEGQEVKVIAGVQGDLVVQVKGAQVAISRQAANHIVTTAAR